MRIIKKILMWFLTIFFAVGIIAAFPSLACVFSFLLVLIFLPIEGWQNLIGKVLKGAIKIIVIVAVLILFFAYFPTSESGKEVPLPSDKAASSDIIDTSETPYASPSPSITPSESSEASVKPGVSPTPSAEPSEKPTPSTTPKPSATPTPSATPRPSSTPTPAPTPTVVQGITILSLPGTVAPNTHVTLSIQGKANTDYTISVYYSSGASHANGLEKKTSDGNGYVQWTWKVGGKTAPGTYRIVVSGGGTSITTYFTVT